jgi:hypothetical protein
MYFLRQHKHGGNAYLGILSDKFKTECVRIRTCKETMIFMYYYWETSCMCLSKYLLCHCSSFYRQSNRVTCSNKSSSQCCGFNSNTRPSGSQKCKISEKHNYQTLCKIQNPHFTHTHARARAIYIYIYIHKVVQIWPGLFVCKQVTVFPGHIWTTLYIYMYIYMCIYIYIWPILDLRKICL